MGPQGMTTAALVRDITNRAIANASAIRTLILALVVATAWQAMAQDRAASYARMSPLDQYLTANRNDEIALARSAAPVAISRDATVLILGRRGYETAIEGANGFTCLVERSWMSPFDSPEFWNPKLRGPICYNPPAGRSVLPWTFRRTALVLGGRSRAQMMESVRAASARKELPSPEAGAMSYMMSKEGYLGDSIGHWRPHLMFHVPKTDASNWGANLPDSPVLLNAQFREVPEPETILMVAVDSWSDGTAAPTHEH
jgi:hypothetical protein